MKKFLLFSLPSGLILYEVWKYYHQYSVFCAPCIEDALKESPQLLLPVDPRYFAGYIFLLLLIQLIYLVLVFWKRTNPNLLPVALILNFILSTILLTTISAGYWALQSWVIYGRCF